MERIYIFLTLVGAVVSLDNGVALLPPMGYTTWNDVGADVSEEQFLANCDALISTGLSSLGFIYCNIDEGWPTESREEPSGKIMADPVRFPNGIRGLADYVHAGGLKLGIYTDRGTETCGGYPGSLGYEAQDATQYAEWEVDYVKEDNCKAPGGPNNRTAQLEEFGLMRDSLNATGRPIVFAVCGGGGEPPWANLSYFAEPPFGTELANYWRIGPDTIGYETMRHNLALDTTLYPFAGPGGWNDADMLLGSNADAKHHCSPAQSRAQFSMWSTLAAPLFISASIPELSEWDLETFSNAEVVAVDQDALGKQGVPLVYEEPLGERLVLGRELADGGLAAVFVNSFPDSGRRNVTCDAICWSKVPQQWPPGTPLAVRDLWKHGPADVPAAVVGEPYSVLLNGQGNSAMFKFTTV